MANYYHVCIPSLVTDLSATLWNMHQAIDGTRNETYESYRQLPAFWVSACNVIDAEIARINASKSNKQHQELLAALKRSTGSETNGK